MFFKIKRDYDKDVTQEKKVRKAKKRKTKKTLLPTTQDTIRFKNIYEDGIMNIDKDWYSNTFKLGDVEYITARQEDKISIIDSYADALNLLEGGSNFQLLVMNKRVTKEKLDSVKYQLQDDSYDAYREEYNRLIENRFRNNSKAFEVNKYITIAIEGVETEQARRQLSDISKDLTSHFSEMDITFQKLNGVERLALFNELLNDEQFNYNFSDIEESNISEKSFIAPQTIDINENYLQINDKFTKIMYIKTFPKSLGDKLIKNLTNLSFEIIISLNLNLYEDEEISKEIDDVETKALINLVKSQKKASKDGIFLSEEFIGAGRDKINTKLTRKWKEEIEDYDQKIFKGFFAVYLKADSLEQLKDYESQVRRAGNKLGVKFDDIHYYQEEALNTILPIGDNFVDSQRKVSRRMTTSNVATQVPFTQVDVISHSPKAMYYGQNQLSNNMITIDRKRDLLTGSGVITGVSGSGKSMAVKINEIIPNLLRYPDDEIIIVDPENEYGDIGHKFNAQVIDLSIGSDTYINVLDLPDERKLDEIDRRKVIENKSNLITTFFEDILEDLTDKQITIIDRVTRQVYKFFKNPTLKEWHKVLVNQPEMEAQELALQVEIYTIGSQSLFSNRTNVNLENKFIVFNLNNLSGKLKPLALSVIQDFIWNKVVKNRGKRDSWLYFDELQLYFRTQKQATFFTELYSRVRKYGAIPTGITQNVETINNIEEGRKLLSNSEFMVILKQKKNDIAVWKEIISLTEEQIKYIASPKAKGTGIIYAGGVVVPFENPIPKESKLFKLVETDAY